jgi:hypothetical protein
MKKLLLMIDYKTMQALEWATTTKGAFWSLFFLIVIANALNPPKDVQTLLLIMVSEFYQGVALPGLGAQQKKEGEETRGLMLQIHEEELQEIAVLKEMHDNLNTTMEEIKEILTILHSQNGGK